MVSCLGVMNLENDTFIEPVSHSWGWCGDNPIGLMNIAKSVKYKYKVNSTLKNRFLTFTPNTI